MEKSQMMMLVVVMAICCFSCISSATMVAGVGNSLGPLNDLLNSQQGGLELVSKECKRCQENNWEGTTIEGGDIQCSEYKKVCIIEDNLIKSCRKCRENNWEGTVTGHEGQTIECNKVKIVCDAIEAGSIKKL
jgi:hypothetical protein